MTIIQIVVVSTIFYMICHNVMYCYVLIIVGTLTIVYLVDNVILP